MAVEESRNGTKKIAERTARLRWRPAAQTPRRRDTTVWKAQLVTVNRTVTVRDWVRRSSCSNFCQLASPTGLGSPSPFQVVKERYTARTMGATAKKAKNSTPGTAKRA
jgi:hypothetical protein